MITGVVVLDYWGIIKADIGIRDGRIVAMGKAGNPDIMTGVHPQLVVGPSTEIIAGNGRIVTAGGIDTSELDARTMESKRVPGLYFIGEVVDVTGWLGGYNFQWAWASGVAAGRIV